MKKLSILSLGHDPESTPSDFKQTATPTIFIGAWRSNSFQGHFSKAAILLPLLVSTFLAAGGLTEMAHAQELQTVELYKRAQLTQTAATLNPALQIYSLYSNIYSYSTPGSPHATNATLGFEGSFTPDPASYIGMPDPTFYQGFSTWDDLNAAFNDAPFVLSYTVDSTLYSPTIDFSGITHPNDPFITNGYWDGGNLLVDSTSDYELEFTPSGQAGTLEFTLLDENYNIVFDQFLTATDSSILLPANALEAGKMYSGAFSYASDFVPTSGSSDAAGTYGGYQSLLTFNVDTVPEPNGLGLLLAGILGAGLFVLRRRTA